jgi:quinol monooxygenase YgiN
MSVKIVIERKFKKAPVPEILQLIHEIRINALRDRGYIGGETVVNVDDDREVLVFSAWSSVNDWEIWYKKKDWKELEKELAPHLAEPAKIRVLMPGAEYVKMTSGELDHDSGYTPKVASPRKLSAI